MKVYWNLLAFFVVAAHSVGSAEESYAEKLAKNPFYTSPEKIQRYKRRAGTSYGYGTDLPEWGKNVSQIIGDVYHYPVEVHNVTTGDGYILSMQRIPRGVKETRQDVAPCPPKTCVFLQHGMMGFSGDWIQNLPDQSLAYLLADAGFDVWLGNVRGNSYGLGHRGRLNSSQPRFWDFTWQDMARDDLPSMLGYITNATGQSACHYIGHSQGTLIAFAALSTDASFQKMIKMFIALAPVHNTGNIGSAFLKDLAKHEREIVALLEKLGDYSTGQVFWILDYVKPVCFWGPEFLNACDALMLNLYGPEVPSHVNMTRMPLFIEDWPDTTSVKNLAHFGQLVDSDQMQKYDYGHLGNLEKYGQLSPPLYDVTTIPNPMVFYYSETDQFADAQDVRDLIAIMPNVHVHMLTDYSHNDFTWSIDAHERVYKSAIQHLKDYDQLNKEKVNLFM